MIQGNILCNGAGIFQQVLDFIRTMAEAISTVLRNKVNPRAFHEEIHNMY